MTEYAGFADATVHLTDKLDLQIGGRESFNRQVFREVDSGPYTMLFDSEPSPAIYNAIRTSDSSFTYLVSPSFKVSRDLMFYARVATGFRPGGPNSNAALFGAPPKFSPDKTENFEPGAKGAVLDNLLTFDASVYYFNWKDIQISVLTPEQAAFFENAGNAKSEGVELAQELRPIRGLTIKTWEVWNEAVLTTAFPQSGAYVSPVTANSGDRLPWGSRWSRNMSIDENLPMGKATAYLRPEARYVGPRWDNFSTVIQRTLVPGHVEFNMLAGVQYEGWKVDLSVRNLGDRRGILGDGINGNNLTTSPRLFYYNQPRTVGLSLAYAF